MSSKIKMFDDKGNHTLPYFKKEVKRMFDKVDVYLKSKNKKYNKPRDRVPFRLKMRDFVFKERGFGGDVLFWHVVNSIFNRPFNEVHTIIVDKLVYAIHIIYGYASYGYLPVSIIQNKRYKGLLAKDRGHITTILKIFLSKTFGIKVWNAVIQKLHIEKRLHPSELKQITDRVGTMTKKGGTLEEVIPIDIFDEFMEGPVSIEIAIETLDNHLTEIEKINNNQNEWTLHQLVLLGVQKSIQFDSTIDDNRLDTIYGLITTEASDYVKEMFRGEKTFWSSTKSWANKRVNFEEESLYLWLTSILLRSGEPKKTVHYHMFNGNITHLKKAYPDIARMSDDDIQKEINFLVAISKSETLLENFLNKVDDLCDEYQEANPDIRLTNIKDLRATKKIGAALSTALCIRNIMEKLNLRIDNVGDVQEIANEVYKAGMERLDNVNHFELIREASATLSNRAKYFYIPIEEQVIEDRENEDSEDVVKKKHWIDFNTKMDSNGAPTIFDIFDRKKSNVFEPHIFDRTQRLGGQLGHKKTNILSFDESYLAAPQDNILNGSNDIDDMVKYADKYEKDFLKYIASLGGRDLLNQEQYNRYRNTLLYIDYMRGM